MGKTNTRGGERGTKSCWSILLNVILKKKKNEAYLACNVRLPIEDIFKGFSLKRKPQKFSDKYAVYWSHL